MEVYVIIDRRSLDSPRPGVLTLAHHGQWTLRRVSFGTGERHGRSKRRTGMTSRSLLVGAKYLINRPGAPARRATILNVRQGKAGPEAYVTFEGADKRLDTWVPEAQIGEEMDQPEAGPSKKRASQDVHANDMTVTVESSPRIDVSPSAPSTPEREHAELTKVRNFEDVRFGEFLIKTWYYSPYPMPSEEKSEHASTPLSSKKRKTDGVDGSAADKPDKVPSHKSRSHGEVFASVGKGGEGARGRLWVCDYCFKYMRTRDGWTRHKTTCEMLRPPGKKVYQRGSYSIWEVDGAQCPLYCQNLSLFGKLFIDHKSVFFHVENFLFYVICDASTSQHDLVMAFFSKEKLSYDDYNLACIVTFPPCQNRGFGKLLIEFSYFLTKHPSTRSENQSPGTPERPLSDLGLKGYTAYWVSTILRVCRSLLSDAPSVTVTPQKTPVKPVGRSLRERRTPNVAEDVKTITINDVGVSRVDEANHPGHYGISLTLTDLAKACHLRVDDTAFTLSELGFLKHHRTPEAYKARLRTTTMARSHSDDQSFNQDAPQELDEDELGQWKDVEVVITKGMVDEQWDKWRVKEHAVLDESCVLI
ncbi:acyl-CoA N-acyltransferase [Papiliotrema laurentii]|uniref:histone acetyltransferase n=1 Tax=Papiliotrema laurentii TaxID=5418 RepID=A0AAD9L767_PAPLA|nr:acyl-CoA N-acyltransferase [Papiliotrema laurentii]